MHVLDVAIKSKPSRIWRNYPDAIFEILGYILTNGDAINAEGSRTPIAAFYID